MKKFDVNYLYIIGTILIITIFISLLAVTINTAAPSIIPSIPLSDTADMGPGPGSAGAPPMGPPASVQMGPPASVQMGPPASVQMGPPVSMQMGGPPTSNVEMPPNVVVPISVQTVKPMAAGPSFQQPSMGPRPSIPQAPTKVNPVLTKPIRSGPGLASGSGPVRGNIGGTPSGGSSSGSSGLTQGLIQ
jgi:hypothetical protein